MIDARLLVDDRSLKQKLVLLTSIQRSYLNFYFLCLVTGVDFITVWFCCSFSAYFFVVLYGRSSINSWSNVFMALSCIIYLSTGIRPKYKYPKGSKQIGKYPILSNNYLYLLGYLNPIDILIFDHARTGIAYE